MKSGATEEDVDRVLEGFRSYEATWGFANFKIGPAAPSLAEGKDPAWDYAYSFDFADAAQREEFFFDEEHNKILAANRELIEAITGLTFEY
jgi:hypothetical protein